MASKTPKRSYANILESEEGSNVLEFIQHIKKNDKLKKMWDAASDDAHRKVAEAISAVVKSSKRKRTGDSDLAQSSKKKKTNPNKPEKKEKDESPRQLERFQPETIVRQRF